MDTDSTQLQGAVSNSNALLAIEPVHTREQSSVTEHKLNLILNFITISVLTGSLLGVNGTI